VTLQEDPPYDLQDPNRFSAPALNAEDEAAFRAFNKALQDVDMTTCHRCNERWFDMNLQYNICQQCRKDDLDSRRKNGPFMWTAGNDMDPGVVDPALPVLTQTEEMLIARVHVYVEVRQVRGQQYRYTGNVVNFYRKNTTVFAKLPQLPRNIEVLVLKPSNTNSNNRLQRQFSRDHRVRRSCIYQWLVYLKANHPGYRDVDIDTDTLNQLPEDGDVSDQLPTLEVDPLQAEQAAPVVDPVGPQLPQEEELDAAALAELAELDDDVEYSAIPDIRPDISDLEYLRGASGADAADWPALSIPSIRATPINEYNASDKTLSLAFPTLYPTGAADFNCPRQRTVSYDAYVKHLMRYKDGRFARHPRWRYVVFNTKLRRQANTRASYIVNKMLGDVSLEEIRTAFAEDAPVANKVLDQITRSTTAACGTRPYWASKRNDLIAMVRQLDTPALFATHSAADLQWQDLARLMPNYDEWKSAIPARRVQIARKNLTDNPHIATWWFDKRHSLFKQMVLKLKLGISDDWERMEYQSRGSDHCHEFLWCAINNLPCLKDNDTADRLRAFCETWGIYLTAVNPDPERQAPPAGECSALQMHPDEMENTIGFLSNVLHRTCIHRCGCYCLRHQKGQPPTEPKFCRFHYPRPVNVDDLDNDNNVVDAEACQREPPPRLTDDWHPKYKSFEAVRNHSNVVPFNRLAICCWRANCDFLPCTGKEAVINYAAKYGTKAEAASKPYKELMQAALRRTPQDSNLHKTVAGYLCSFVSERDWTAAEVSHLLLGMPLSRSSRSHVSVDCRPESEHNIRYVTSADDTLQLGTSVLTKYKTRADTIENVTYLDFLLHHEHNKKPYKRRPQAKPRILNYMPYYKSDTHPEDYYRVKAMLHHPFRGSVDSLKEGFDSWEHHYRHCLATNCEHSEDWLNLDIVAQNFQDEADEFEEGDEQAASQVPIDWAELSRAIPRGIDEEDAWGDLGNRDIDVGCDWLQTGISDELYAQVEAGEDYWTLLKEQSALRAESRFVEQGQESTLNITQRQVYDYLMRHYQYELTNGRHPDDNRQLLLHIDGSAGTGKSYLIEIVSSHLAQLAAHHGRGDPVIRCAPTGVAAHNISGYTLHRLFHINPKKPDDPISNAQRSRFQAELRSVRYIIIDEKSMVSLAMLGALHGRCCEAFPEFNHLPFGGANVIICGDFAQLPPVGGKALYMPLTPDIKRQTELVGVEMYRQFDRTIVLTHIMRQIGEDEESRAFRDILNSLRDGSLSVEQWQRLTRRWKGNLSLTEIDEFSDALRIFPVKTSVSSYNYQKLRSLQTPAIVIQAKNSGSGKAKDAPTDIASNLQATIPLCLNCRVMLTKNIWIELGLVNGAMGTVRHILWKPDTVDPKSVQPAVVFVEIDGFAPASPGSIDIDGRCCVPIFPVTHEFYYDGQECHRTQFPLALAYAITVHKSQGISTSKAVLDISDAEFSVGLTYVAISRVRTFKGLAFEKAFDHERLVRRPRRNDRGPNVLKMRRLDTERRAQQPLVPFDPTVRSVVDPWTVGLPDDDSEGSQRCEETIEDDDDEDLGSLS